MSHRILIVDDDPVVRMLVTEYLGACGHDVTAVECGAACLEKLQDGGSLPELVIVDYQMPEMSGIEVVEKLRLNPDTAQLPIMMLSANASECEEQSVHKANLYFMKPFQMKDFLSAVESLVNGQKTNQP
jgi:CheY-like chemotaxis protein